MALVEGDRPDLQQRLNTGPDARTVRVSWSIFPVNCGTCLPCLPSSWAKVQDWLHLVLICGILGSLVCAIYLAIELYEESCGQDLKCYISLLSVALILPTTLDFISRIGAYDDQLQVKEEKQKAEVEKLVTQINETVDKMNDMIGNMAQHANDLAKNAFLDKINSFKRFVRDFGKSHQRAASTHVTIIGSNAEEQLLQDFKVYAKQWVSACATGLYGTVHLQSLQVLHRNIEKCTSVKEVCDEVKKSLGSWVDVNARFATSQQQHRMTLPAPVQSDSDPETGGEGGSSGSTTAPEQRTKKKIGVNWIKREANGHCFHYEMSSRTEDRRWPHKLYAGRCVTLTILSKEHRWYMMAFLMDVFLILIEFLTGRTLSGILVILNAYSLLCLLLCFEQIDKIAKIERQIQTYQQHQQDVATREQALLTEWQKMDQYHELWKYRTLPCLSIMEKVQECILELDEEKAGVFECRQQLLNRANQTFQKVEQSLGDVDAWMGPDPLHVTWKDTIGKRILDEETRCKELDVARIGDCLRGFPALLEPQREDVAGSEAEGGASASQPRSSPRQSPRGQATGSSGSQGGSSSGYVGGPSRPSSFASASGTKQAFFSGSSSK